MSDMIRVLLADAHTLTQLGVHSLLDSNEEIEVIGIAGTLEEAHRLCDQHQPDVLVLSLNLPHQDLSQTIDLIKHICPPTQVMMLTSEANVPVQTLLTAGVTSYVFKDKSAQEIVDAIGETAAGKPHVGADALRALVNAQQSDDLSMLLSTLTDRESEILTLISHGNNNQEIAEKLCIVPSTVSTHITSIYEKLGFDDRSKLVAWLWKIGFVSD